MQHQPIKELGLKSRRAPIPVCITCMVFFQIHENDFYAKIKAKRKIKL